MISPWYKRLNILGLGYSEGTGGRVIKAPIIVVKSFKELDDRANEVPGKIVVYNFRYESYSAQVQYRSYGASRASKYGAVAALIRSLTPFSLNTVHTGMQCKLNFFLFGLV